MQSLLQTEEYGQPFSTLCMELCIKDVNEATHDLLKKYHQSISLTNTPSWKFPHISMDKLDILPIIDKYRNKSLSEYQQYQELLELLVDRVCFSLMATCKLLGTSFLDNSTNNEANSSTTTTGYISPHHIGQGDSPINPVLLQFKNKMINSSQKSLPDNSTITSHPNVALLLKQLYDTITTILDGRILSKEQRNHKKNNKSKLICTSAQTLESSSTACETCFVAFNLLKFLSTMITECLTTFTSDPSEISKLKKDGESKWNLSHREFLYEWCQAVQADCKNLMEIASKVLEEKATLQKCYNESKSTLESESAKLINLTNEFQLKMKASQDMTELEKRKNETLEHQFQLQNSNVAKLQEELNEKEEECRKNEAKIAELSESLAKKTLWHQQLHEKNSTTEKLKLNLEQEMQALKTKTNYVEKDLAKMESLVRLKDEEIEKLTNSLDKCMREEVKKDEMKGLLEKAKKQLEACKKVEDEHKRSKVADKVMLEKLKEEVTLQQEQIELLTLYPDLNGPINPPKDEENPIQAMVHQVRSNQLRIQVLQAQTERLNLTLTKCNVGFNNMSTKSRMAFDE